MSNINKVNCEYMKIFDFHIPQSIFINNNSDCDSELDEGVKRLNTIL